MAVQRRPFTTTKPPPQPQPSIQNVVFAKPAKPKPKTCNTCSICRLKFVCDSKTGSIMNINVDMMDKESGAKQTLSIADIFHNTKLSNLIEIVDTKGNIITP